MGEGFFSMTFIVRVSADEAGRVSGIVERVRTGEKERFYGVEAIAPIIARMVEKNNAARRAERPWPIQGSHER